MEKVTEFIKKNWGWVLIALAVIIYFIKENRKKAESNFRVSASSVRRKPTLYNTGWYNFSGSFYVNRDKPGEEKWYGKCGSRWDVNTSCRFNFSASTSAPGKIEGYYFGGQFRVKRIILNVPPMSVDFNGDTFFDTRYVTPTEPNPNSAYNITIRNQYPLLVNNGSTITPIQTTQITQ